MVGLIVLIILIARYRRQGRSWLGAISRGIGTYFVGVIAFYAVIFLLVVGFGFADTTLRPIATAVIGTLPSLQPSIAQPPRSTGITPNLTPAAITAPRRTPTPRPAVPTSTPLRLNLDPTPPATEPMNNTPLGSGNPMEPTATVRIPLGRMNCDPAYPDARTCIPPGPPFDQGCRITSERLFTVLPPDPQRLDADRDGIGCEPMN